MSEKIDIKNKLDYVDKYITENSCDDLAVKYFVDILNYIYKLESKFSKQRKLYKELQTDTINLQQRIDNAVEELENPAYDDAMLCENVERAISILKGEDKEC